MTKRLIVARIVYIAAIFCGNEKKYATELHVSSAVLEETSQDLCWNDLTVEAMKNLERLYTRKQGSFKNVQIDVREIRNDVG